MPIDQALKDTITQYTDKMSDDEIVNHLATSQKYADVAAKIKQAQASGMSSKDILDQAMSAQITPTAAPKQGYVAGVAQAGGDLAKKALPWMFDGKQGQPPQTTPVTPQNAAPQANPSPSTEEARPFGRPAKLGAPEPVLETPPSEAVQTGMGIVNKLPQYGAEAGTAVGMALAPEMGPEMIPATAGLLSSLGKTVQTPLTNLLLPKANAQPAGAMDVAGAGLQGATTGAANAVMMKGMNAPAESLADLLAPAKEGTANLSKYMSRRTLKQPLNPEVERATSTIPKEGFNVVGGKGPMQVADKVNEISRQVDAYIGQAAEQGKTIKVNDMLAPARQLQAYYGKSADTADYASKLGDYIAQVETKFPAGELSPPEAQDVKKFVYDAVNFDAKGTNTLGQVGTQGKRALGRGLRTGIEEAAPEVGPLNQRLGDILQARPYVEKASEMYSQAPLRARAFGQVKQAGARLANAASEGLGAAEEAVRPEAQSLAEVASPFANLERTLGMKYPRLSNEVNTAETRPNRLLPTSEESAAGRNQFQDVGQPTEQGMGMGRKALPPGTQYGPLPGEGAPRTNRFGGSVPVPENLPDRGYQGVSPMGMKDIIDRVASGQGHTITAEEKVSLADQLLNHIKFKLSGEGPVNPKDTTFNFNERMKE